MKYLSISKTSRVILQLQSIASIIMTSPSTNHVSFIASEKDIPPVGILEEIQETPHASVHGERVYPRNGISEDMEIFGDLPEPFLLGLV